MEAPKLDTIEIGNTLEKAESDLISGLKLEAFDKDAKKENIDEMKDVLKSTKINVITSAVGVVSETKEALSLGDIATQFDKYVEQGEGWKLKAKEKDTAGNPLIIPEWIKYIVENPKNNDLAYFVQKIAELVEYQTAKAYTASEVNAVEVGVDKAFGNQTRRALAGLKNWIEDTATTEVTEGKTYEGKYIAKMFLEGLISSGKTDAEKSAALKKYNLQYKDKKIIPLDTYEFVDPNSNNYAVIKGGTKDKEVVSQNSGKLDSYGNTMMTMTDINQLPKDSEGNYKRDASEKKMYTIVLDGIVYDFWNNGRSKSEADNKMKSSKEIVTDIIKKQNEKAEMKEDSQGTWKIEDIKKQLKGYSLDSDEGLITQIQTKKYEYDSLEYGSMYIAIRKGNISVYLSKEDFEKKNTTGKSEKLKEDIKKREIVRNTKIKTLLASINYDTITDASGKLGLKLIPGVFFNNQTELDNFKKGINIVISKYAYNSFMESPFKLSEKGNVYRDNGYYTGNQRLFLENAGEKLGPAYDGMKYIEDYKGNSEDNKIEIQKVVAYLNNLSCWSSKMLIEGTARPY